ncbi:MAG: hypothetical protein JWR05_2103 [Mucilaginibacter sp.]|nr:hypothetical protein [Mucilaginibacter sp.]
MDKKQIQSASKFIVVGGISTIINYGVFYILLRYFKVNYLVASISGYITGLIVGFGLNNFWTFNTKQVKLKIVISYVLVYLFSLGLSSFCLWLLVNKLGFNAFAMNIICIGISTVSNFLCLSYFTYKK